MFVVIFVLLRLCVELWKKLSIVCGFYDGVFVILIMIFVLVSVLFRFLFVIEFMLLCGEVVSIV